MAKDGKKTPGGSPRSPLSEDEMPTLQLDMSNVESEAEKPRETKLSKSKPVASMMKMESLELEKQSARPRSFSGEQLKPRRNFEMAPRPSLPIGKFVIFVVLAGLVVFFYLNMKDDFLAGVSGASIQVIREPRATADMPMGKFRLNLNPKADRHTEIRIGDQLLNNAEDIRFSMLFNKGSVITITRDGFRPYTQTLFYTGYPSGITGDIPVDIDLMPERYGTLALTSSVPARVTIEGQSGVWVKFSPVYNLTVPTGEYSIRFSRLDNGKEIVQNLTVRETSWPRSVKVSRNLPSKKLSNSSA